MKKVISLLLVSMLLIACNQTKSDGKEAFDNLPRLTLEELDQKIAAKEEMIVYYGWTVNCGDSLNFQNNYLIPTLAKNPSWAKKLYVLDLDTYFPDALVNKELRKPMIEKYNVQFSPTLIYYSDVNTKVEWTVRDSDPETGLNKELMDYFFSKVK